MRQWTGGAIAVYHNTGFYSYSFDFHRPNRGHYITVEDARILLGLPPILRRQSVLTAHTSVATTYPFLQELYPAEEITWFEEVIPTIPNRLSRVCLSVEDWADSFGFAPIPMRARAEVAIFQHQHQQSQSQPIKTDEEKDFILQDNMIVSFREPLSGE